MLHVPVWSNVVYASKFSFIFYGVLLNRLKVKTDLLNLDIFGVGGGG